MITGGTIALPLCRPSSAPPDADEQRNDSAVVASLYLARSAALQWDFAFRAPARPRVPFSREQGDAAEIGPKLAAPA